MSTTIRWVNLGLGGILIWVCWVYYVQNRSARERNGIFQESQKESHTAPSIENVQATSVRASDYSDIANQFLFTPDRNSAIEILVRDSSETISLPILHGVANLGNGPVALLATHSGEKPQWTLPGEMIGNYVLESIGPDELVFEKDGRRIETAREDLLKDNRRRTVPISSRTPVSRSSNRTSALSSPSSAPGIYRIGQEFRPGRFTADETDGADDGTRYQGYIRRVRTTPFGKQHWWEKETQ